MCHGRYKKQWQYRVSLKQPNLLQVPLDFPMRWYADGRSLSFGLSQYPGSLEDIDSEYVSMELSSDCGKACDNATSILYDEEFQLAARSYVRSTAYRKEEPNLTKQMFYQWAKEKFSIEICTETARRWLHHLGVIIRKVYFLMVTNVKMFWHIVLETLARLDETTITPAQPSPCVEDGKQRHTSPHSTLMLTKHAPVIESIHLMVSAPPT